MEYFLNEFSLTGQFNSIEDFYSSFRDNMYEVLITIEKDDNTKIYKCEDFWKLPVTVQNVTINDALRYSPGKNRRITLSEQIKALLNRIITKKPFLEGNRSVPDIVILEHGFDNNEEIHNKGRLNSIYCVACNNKNRRLLSFRHDNYEKCSLRLIIKHSDNSIVDIDIQNVFSISSLNHIRGIKKWPLVENKYWVEVRAHEIDRHEPHFHVCENRIEDRGMVFSIDNCRILEPRDRKLIQWEKDMSKTIDRWFKDHKSEIETAWYMLHPVTNQVR